MGKPNAELEKKLREKWKSWENTCHPEDSMSFVDYCEETEVFEGHWVTVYREGTLCEILFAKRV